MTLKKWWRGYPNNDGGSIWHFNGCFTYRSAIIAFLHLARRIITPLVSGIVVMIIGLSLIQVGLTSIGGGYAAIESNTFGSPKNLLLAGSVLSGYYFT